eukprot:SAG31_NODE_25169_length_466_cov_1.449591_1_plen_58_part_10
MSSQPSLLSGDSITGRQDLYTAIVRDNAWKSKEDGAHNGFHVLSVDYYGLLTWLVVIT